MILSRGHSFNRVAVHKGKHGHFTPCHKLFDNHFIACRAKLLIQHDRLNALFRLLEGAADQHALSKGKPVCLENNRKLRRLKIRKSLVRIGKILICSRRDIVFFHQILGKCL